jgi:hypothetical protein
VTGSRPYIGIGSRICSCKSDDNGNNNNDNDIIIMRIEQIIAGASD